MHHSPMMENGQLAVWEFISQKQQAGWPVVLLLVLESKGSSPGRQGFRMAVSADDDFCGTIGGGIMEHKFVETARDMLRKDKAEAALQRQVHDKSSSEQSGMICSGEQTLWIYPVRQDDLAHIDRLILSLKKDRNGSLTIIPSGIFFSEELPAADFFYKPTGQDFIYIEKTGYRNVLHVIGGGHCSLALSKLMREMDFYIHVYDDRKDLLTMQQNIYAHRKWELDDYSLLSNHIEGGAQEYAVIMTFGYRTDDQAFRALHHKPFRYLGMLGSKKKIEKMFTDYRLESMDTSLLGSIYAPVGLQIKSETAAEIAVSIAAEIISVKNKNQ